MDLSGQLLSDDGVLKLCDVIRQTAYDIHVYLKNGYLEKVYENALAHRLSKLGMKVLQQHSLQVFDEDGTQIGLYSADLFVEDRIIIELKACKDLADEHTAQLFGYMKAARIRHGMLINFGAPKVQIRKYVS